MNFNHFHPPAFILFGPTQNTPHSLNRQFRDSTSFLAEDDIISTIMSRLFFFKLYVQVSLLDCSGYALFPCVLGAIWGSCLQNRLKYMIKNTNLSQKMPNLP